MHILLSALAGLSIAGTAAAPVLATTNNQQVAQTRTVDPQAGSQEISFNGKQSLDTDQSEAGWNFDFDYTQGQAINRIEFLGGGLAASVWWGSDRWDYNYSTIDINSSEMGNWVTLFNEGHSSFLATQKAMLRYKLTHVQGTTYNLSIYFYTQSFNSFSSSTGYLNIGTGIRAITN